MIDPNIGTHHLSVSQSWLSIAGIVIVVGLLKLLEIYQSKELPKPIPVKKKRMYGSFED